MPVARIFTVHPERTDALSRQLKSQGYTVEVVPPDTAVGSPAELEIDFEIWPEESVLEHAAELAEELHTDVAVAPGLALSRTEDAPSQPASSTVQAPQDNAPMPAVELAQPETAQVEQTTAASATPGSFAEPMSVAPMTPQIDRTRAVRQERDLEPDQVYFAPEQHEPNYDMGAPVTQDIMSSQTARAGLVAEMWDSLRHAAMELSERWRIWLAERNAQQEERLLELTQRKTLAQERANELQVARQAASARLQELVRAGGTEPAPAPASQEEDVPPIATFPLPEPRESWLRRQASWFRRTLLSRHYSPQVQAILTGVAAMTALFVLGMAIASFRPRPALSNSLDHPYKGVTVQTGGATVAPTKPPATKSATTTPRPSPAVRTSPATGKQSPAHRTGSTQNLGDDVTVKRLPPPAKARSNPSQSGGDASVKHMSAQTSKPAPKNTQQTGLKRISDLDN